MSCWHDIREADTRTTLTTRFPVGSDVDGMMVLSTQVFELPVSMSNVAVDQILLISIRPEGRDIPTVHRRIANPNLYTLVNLAVQQTSGAYSQSYCSTRPGSPPGR